jgi:hypothetical protein
VSGSGKRSSLLSCGKQYYSEMFYSTELSGIDWSVLIKKIEHNKQFWNCWKLSKIVENCWTLLNTVENCWNLLKTVENTTISKVYFNGSNSAPFHLSSQGVNATKCSLSLLRTSRQNKLECLLLTICFKPVQLLHLIRVELLTVPTIRVDSIHWG